MHQSSGRRLFSLQPFAKHSQNLCVNPQVNDEIILTIRNPASIQSKVALGVSYEAFVDDVKVSSCDSAISKHNACILNDDDQSVPADSASLVVFLKCMRLGMTELAMLLLLVLLRCKYMMTVI